MIPNRQSLLLHWPLAMASGFLLFVLVLAWTLYSTQVQLRAATDARLLADSARRAAVVEDFLFEQEKLATQLARSDEIEDYLTNEALGMSPRYGLNANVSFIEQRFQKTIERISLRGDAFLRHIGFARIDGAFVASVGDGATPEIVEIPQTVQRPQINARNWTIEVVAPVFFKNTLVGAITTTADLKVLSKLLIEAEDSAGGYHEFLLIGDGGHALSPREAKANFELVERSLAELPANRLTPAVSDRKSVEDMLALRTPINGAPLSLVTLTSAAAAYGGGAPPAYALYLAAFAAALFLMAIGFERQRRRAAQLKSDFAESDRRRHELSQHNTALSEEIALRKALEEDLRRKTRALKETNSDLRIAATAFESQEGMVVTDARHRILRANRTFSELTGYAPDDLVGQSTASFNSQSDTTSLYAEIIEACEFSGRWQGEVWLRTRSGGAIPRWLTVSAVQDETGGHSHYVKTYYDLSERKEAEAKIRSLAFYDQLTGLPNRTILVERARQAMAQCRDLRTHAALLFVDLDQFKRLNDTLGHHKGDLLLKQSAARLLRCVSDGDTVSRFGGDEFVVLLTDLGASDIAGAALQAEAIAETIIASLAEPQNLDGHSFRCTASIGVALFHDDGQSMDDLLKWADMAMYDAKTSGRNAVRFFDPAMQKLIEARAAIEAALREDIARNNILLHYQPQVDDEGRLVGAEALLRWPRADRDAPSPVEVVEVAENSGLMIPLGDAVLESACRQLVEWAKSPALAHLTLAVNVSGVQLHHHGFVERVRTAVERTGADPRLLKLEVTESFEISRIEEVIAKMSVLRDLGIRFSLDDFGTGYSSLSYLKRLPIDQLKIDKSFVRDVISDPNDAAIAETIIALGETLGLSVIAEGVETEEQRAFLADRGCRVYQGYLFARAMPAEPFAQFAALFSRAKPENDVPHHAKSHLLASACP
ncbi:diguanylate cyclase (GGDEF)-like protein/PAS domain S-box-containing protein [Rhodoblastus acidophilus]|uniref:bifunctional diguanylate cyclase/phosphodiesterase n=1 Tax=Rhodoblastus acidophilus TaxID=1074 RepID=UPI00222419B3|nr:EAL domain-containing protein [Rhodoblastus acidophilus]MCW2283267.1 diguanylate cyclase (GGDEF)-like protein/PAS domain S-box-containing protein [Rhodoblastus acidophilus]MCW2332127.1 diguanylate cyclase (GGDEF)-like protein/PAS domain S-box-containing protein [Rhodoblastus acidophilus]